MRAGVNIPVIAVAVTKRNVIAESNVETATEGLSDPEGPFLMKDKGKKK